MDARERALSRAHDHAVDWLASLGSRRVPPRATTDEVATALGRDLPDGPTDPADVVDLLAAASDPGLTAMPSGRFYGMVIGGTHPAALAADWLVSAWDQNAALNAVTPAAAAAEQVATAWLLDLLGLPGDAAVGLATGATMANFTCLAAARDAVLRRHGWDQVTRGLTGAPRIRVLVGAERHDSIDLVLRYLGLGTPHAVAVDDQGRIRPDALAAALGDGPADGPAIVALQAGNVHSGAFDPFDDAASLAHERGAWVHVDGAFGLFAAASPRLRHLTRGLADADSWATDAHKTLNVPYDCGLAIVRDRSALTTAMSMHGDYLIQDAAGDPFDTVPELSRRSRAVPVWAVLRSLGRRGVAELVERMADHAQAFAEGVAAIDGAEVLNDVVFTQVCASFGSDERTREVVRRVLDDGTAWMSGSRWRDRAVLRISVCNWSTTDDDVGRSLDALRRAAAG
ncbi:Pyridoxal-dependent decarboxylase [Beutenbergia cavernae DSM 12333]|uniref:Pyridoxal-dependent decarboxylase n=1 Tax=Beutenbergia cavernae (strain ATCC BAA-8 / DSM 12333 / CCUG 43141 / JCM 11478 / NBRC 16432 / NCIMB 13614 / HKI 0122) TaxID=471853 RepID=C5C3S3_BEUC1|nr:aminotransferase class V-fold PLP-dependent enzyme [Beutenbergia cavernae]ACQ81982.1 Pyridoxal-dependent decarboxylase [Beutenbergia cavernae DSM 12333]